MPRKKYPYDEGDWFAVPLPSGGYVLGLVARLDREGSILGYFFGPKNDRLPATEDAAGLSNRDAILVARVSDLALVNQGWLLLGRLKTWSPEEWAVPVFGRISVDEKYVFRVEYSSDDISRAIKEVPTTTEEARRLPADGLYGYRALEIHLDNLLTK